MNSHSLRGVLLWLSLMSPLVGLVGCTEPGESGSEVRGFAGLGESGDGFAAVDPQQQTLSFPADHDLHPEYRIEWWYVTANLQDREGRAYGAQWTLFRQALSADQGEGWQDAQVWMAHAALTTADSHAHAERFGRSGGGQAGVSAQPVYAAWLDHWLLRHIPRPGGNPGADDPLSHLQVRAAGDAFGFELALQTRQPLVLQGDAGYSVKSERGQASWYYSQPFYRANGYVTLANGERVSVNGQAWLDREWSSQPLAPEQSGWDWFSLHLDSGEKIMLFRLREQQDADSFFAGTWIRRDGSTEPLNADQITMTPLADRTVAERSVPTQWRLQVPDHGLDVRTRALNDQAWMGGTVPYWEGPVFFTGSHAGRGYLEMTGY